MRQRLADLMALIIVLAAFSMIFGIDMIPDDPDFTPPDDPGTVKYPIARIEFTLEKLLEQMGISDTLQIDKITA